jgi:hypothetical protein
MFDRNRFKEFVTHQEELIKENCSIDHPKVQYHGIYKDVIWSKSFRSIKQEEFSKLKLLGSLRDPKISRLHYIDFSNREGEYWSENYKIAINFYPYHSSEIYQCKECNRLFVVYTETGGHMPEDRIREIKSELIIEEPGSCVLELSNNDLKLLANYLNYKMEELVKLIDKNKKIERIETNFGNDDIVVSELYENNYLIVCKRELIYDILKILKK